MISAWVGYALLASIIWGIYYVCSEKALTIVSETSLIILSSFIGIMFVIPFFSTFIEDMKRVASASNVDKAFVFSEGVAAILGTFFIYKAIKLSSNATLTSLIEMTYPIFVLLFAYLLLGKTEVNMYTALGGVLILSGAFLVSANS